MSNYGEVFDNLMVVDINKVEGNMKEEGVKSIAHGAWCGGDGGFQRGAMAPGSHGL